VGNESLRAVIVNLARTLSHPLIAILLVSAFALAAYYNSLDVPFQFDDQGAIVANPDIRDLGRLDRVLWHGEPKRPLLGLSLAINYAVVGLEPRGYHLANLGLHIAASLLLYFLIRELGRHAASPDPPVDARLLGLVAALLFATHPVHTESVTYVWGRSGVLCTLCYLGALLLFVRAHPPGEAARAGPWWLALAAFACALASKAIAVSLPLVLLVIDYLFLSQRSARRVMASFVARHVPFFALSAVRIGFALRDPGPGGTSGTEARLALLKLADRWPDGLDAGTNVLTQVLALAKAVGTLALPLGLNADHDFPLVTDLRDAYLLGAALLLVAWCFAAFALRRRYPWAALAASWPLLTLALFFVAPVADPFVERRLYLPSVGFCLGAALLMIYLGRLVALHIARDRAFVVTIGLTGMLACTYSLLTVERNAVWRDPAVLWQDTIAKSPRKARPYSNLAVVRLQQGDAAQALALAETAIALDADYGPAHLNRVDAHLARRDFAAMSDAFVAALQAHPAFATDWAIRRLPYLGPAGAGLREALRRLSLDPGALEPEAGIALGLISLLALGEERQALALLDAHLQRVAHRRGLHYFELVTVRRVTERLRSAASPRG